MNIHVSLQHGPLAVEIEAEGDDDYQRELIELLEFIEKHEERLEGLNANGSEVSSEDEGEGASGQALIDSFATGDTPDEKDEDISETDSSSDNQLESLAKKVGTTPAAIHDIVDLDPQGEEPPFLLVDIDEFGTSKARQQFTGSLLILEIWDECYETDRMKSSLLKDALEYSGIDSSNMYNMYDLENADSFFSKKGRGGSATLKLRRPGKREAQKLFRELVE